MADKKPVAKAEPDWERIEADYRAGILSLREIAEPFEITEGAIRKRAKAKNWSRDLTAKIRARAEDLVRREAVRTESTQPDHRVPEAEIVEASAHVMVAVDRRHKGIASRGINLTEKLMAEIEAVTDNLADFEKLGELLDKTEVTENGRVIEDKLNKAYRAVISLAGRIDGNKKLSETFEKYAKFERVAYRLEDAPAGDDGGTDTTPNNEIARRVAFILQQGLRAQKG